MSIFVIVSVVSWGIAEIFYKLGNIEKEKYSHLKTTIFVGLFFGIFSIVNLFISKVNLETFFINFLRYLPISFCYIISMVCSYFGVRFLEESIADPIENTSIAFVPILCSIFLKETFELPVIIGIIIIVIGLICIGIFDKSGKEKRNNNFGKKIGLIALAMPFCYMIFDAVGTFLDIFYVDDVTTTLLVGVNENNIEATANCCYELAFFLVAIVLYIFIRIKGEKLFKINNKKTSQKWKIFAAIFETIGQATYLYGLSNGGGLAAIILGSGTVIISLLLSRIVLKEKLSVIQYIFIGIILSGIVVLSFLGV